MKLAKGLETSMPLGSVDAQHELGEDRLEDSGISDGLRTVDHESTLRTSAVRPAGAGWGTPGRAVQRSRTGVLVTLGIRAGPTVVHGG